MTDDGFAALLHGTVASFEDDAPDWPDVIKRVRRRRRRQAVTSLVLVAGVVLLLSPATGLGERLLDVFRGSLATPAVKRALGASDRVPPPVLQLLRSDPAVDVSKAHGVMEITTTRGPVRLWEAPRADGGACAFIEVGIEEGRAVGSEACHPPVALSHVQISADLRPIDLQLMQNDLFFAIVFGWKPGIEVTVDWSDGTHSRLPVVDGYALVEVPHGAQPKAAAAVRGTTTLSTQSFEAPAPIPFPADSAFTTVATVTAYDGARVTLGVAESSGKQCIRVATRDSSDGSCGNPGSSPIVVNANLHSAILFGEVQVPAVSLRFTFQDGDHASAPVEHGVFLFAVPRAHLKEGHLPQRVEGFGRDGAVLADVAITR